MGKEMVTGQGLYKTLNPLILYQIEPEISTPEKLAFLLSLGVTLNPYISATGGEG